MNENLHPANTSENCAVLGIDPEVVQRKHFWRWEHENSRIRVCATCLRREDMTKTEAPGQKRGVSP